MSEIIYEETTDCDGVTCYIKRGVLVRCKDCKYFTDGMAIGMCKRNPEKPIIPMPFDAYCSFGKRK